MQTIRIYAKTGGLVATLQGPANRIDEREALALYPESRYNWLR